MRLIPATGFLIVNPDVTLQHFRDIREMGTTLTLSISACQLSPFPLSRTVPRRLRWLGSLARAASSQAVALAYYLSSALVSIQQHIDGG
jgi:hypothetical protein